MRRDEFKQSIIRKLRDRVASRCSNPTCRVPTISAGEQDLHSTVSIGQAAHITAASKNGPRFDADMTEEERKSIENGVWLCNNCARKIDVDPESYPTEVLKRWKVISETRSCEEIGKRLPSEDDGTKALITAFSGCQSNFLRTAIQNVVSSQINYLESLDPRLNVKINYSEGQVNYSVSPRESVDLGFKLHTKEADKQFQELFRHGKDVKLPLSSLVVTGSELFDVLFEEVDGYFKIEGEKLDGVMKVRALDDEGNVVSLFDDVRGRFFVGSESFTFQGRLYSDILGFEVKGYSDNCSKGDFTIDVDYSEWEGAQIGTLPYFAKVFEVLSIINSGVLIEVVLEVRGERVLRGMPKSFSESEYIKSTYYFLDYISSCRSICENLGLNALFDSSVELTKNQLRDVVDCSDKLNGGMRFEKDQMSKELTHEMMIQENFENLFLIKSIKSGTLKIIEPVDKTVTLFDLVHKLPYETIYLSDVTPRIIEEKEVYYPGDSVKVVWDIGDDFHGLVAYENILKTDKTVS